MQYSPFSDMYTVCETLQIVSSNDFSAIFTVDKPWMVHCGM